MTNQTKDKLKSFIYNFVKNHYDELKETPEMYGFNNKSDMLGCIKQNEGDAAWAFFELMDWGMKTDYKKDYLVGYMEDYTPVYKIDNVYFAYDAPLHHDAPCVFNDYGKFIEIKRTTKTVEVFEAV